MNLKQLMSKEVSFKFFNVNIPHCKKILIGEVIRFENNS